MQVPSLGWEDALEKGMATHSGILAWRIPWQRSLAGYSPCGHEEADTTEATQHANPNTVKLPWVTQAALCAYKGLFGVEEGGRRSV